MTPDQIKQLTPDGYGGDFEMTGQNIEKHTNNAGQPSKNVLIAQVNREAAQVGAQDKVQVEGDMGVTRKTKKRIEEANQ